MRAFTSIGLIAALLVSCTPTPAPRPPLAAATASATSQPSAAGTVGVGGLAERPVAMIVSAERWATVPDGLYPDGPVVTVTFPSVDAAGGRPRARLRSTGQTVDLRQTAPASVAAGTAAAQRWTGLVPLEGARVGEQTVDVIVRLRDGSDAVVASSTFQLSMPEYVVWTLDFEGDAASNETLDNTWDIARTLSIPMTIMWNPRVWTTTQVSAERAAVMAGWMKNIADAGMAEIALHLHAWTDFVRAAGVTPRTAPSWAGRSDGYDVPLTAFDEAETRKLIDHGVKLMVDHGMPRPTSFRGGGLFANAANLRAIAAAGFTVDSSGTSAGVFGRLPLPWTLAKDAQPYRPSKDDANAAGDLPLLEAPNIAGNTYALDTRTIQPVIAADRAMLALPGRPATAARVLTLVSHPGTIDATERAAIESLFRALEPYRFDRDRGPVRFITLAQLGKALK